MKRRSVAAMSAIVLTALIVFATSNGSETPVRVTIPEGATLPSIAEVLEAHDVVGSARLFQIYARVRRADRKLKAGDYELFTGSSMRSVLLSLTRGAVVTVTMTIPEGFQLREMAPRISQVTGASEDEVLEAFERAGSEYDLPGPSMEGYLFPDTYRFANGVPVSTVVDAMVARYRDVWTEDRRALLQASGMTEREIVTLASIVQSEARRVDEMPRISGVYHNRLEAGWLLQADPTVLYALGGYRERLLYAAIDSVEDNPYNTYSSKGLPPGPISSPGHDAIDAALSPEDHDFMYFVAWPDGSHIFTRSLSEHNAAKNNARTARAGIAN